MKKTFLSFFIIVNLVPHFVHAMDQALALREEIDKDNPSLDRVNVFIENKADVNAPNTRGETSLMRAVDQENPSLGIVNTLIKNKVDVNTQDANDKTSLDLIASNYSAGFGDLPTQFEIAQIFIHNGADVYEAIEKEFKSGWGKEKTVDFLLLCAAKNIKNCNFDGIDLTGYKFKKWDDEERFIPVVLELARRGFFSILNGRYGSKFMDPRFGDKDKLIFYKKLITAKDENNKTVFDYAVEYKQRGETFDLLRFARFSNAESKSSLKKCCFVSTVNNFFIKIDFEDPETTKQLKGVFSVLTVNYRS